jgi:ABC-type multidrug transport system fused ATPase/permease subunit
MIMIFAILMFIIYEIQLVSFHRFIHLLYAYLFLQEPILFDGTLASNIRLGDEQATHEQVCLLLIFVEI